MTSHTIVGTARKTSATVVRHTILAHTPHKRGYSSGAAAPSGTQTSGGYALRTKGGYLRGAETKSAAVDCCCAVVSHK